MAETAPTREEINRVHRWECEEQGHVFDIVITHQSRDPQSLMCSRCGEAWSLGSQAADERDRLLTAIREHRGIRAGQASDLDESLYRMADEIAEAGDRMEP